MNIEINYKISRLALIVVSMSSFLAAFMGSSINIALPSIGRELHMDAVSLGWVTTSFILASVVSLVPMGRLADIYGRKKVLTYGVIIYTTASFLLSFIKESSLLILLRVVQGIGSAMIFATGVAIIISVFPFAQRGRALGISVAMTYLGLSLGPVLGGLLTEYFGWRSIFLSTIPLGIAILVLILRHMKDEWAEAKGEKFDGISTVIYGLILIGIIYGFSKLPDKIGIALLVAGISGVFFFVRRQGRVRHPLLNIDLFRKSRVFAFSNLATLLNYSALFAVSFLLSLYLQYIKGFSPQSAGLTLVAMPAVQAILSPFTGRLSDRIEPRILASIGMGLNAIGLAMSIFINTNTDIEYIIGILIIMGAGFALFTSPNTNAIMSSVKQRFYGVSSAIMATMRQVGMSFSMGITMMLFSIYIGEVEITPGYYALFMNSTRIAFIIFTALCIAGIFASLSRGNTR